MTQLLLPSRCGLSKVDNVYWCDALTYLRALPDGYVNCIVTSPPYFGLRDYQVAGQIGLEDTPQAFVRTMVELFREAKRVLRDDGTIWINLGDSYTTRLSGDGWGDYEWKTGGKVAPAEGTVSTVKRSQSDIGLGPKNLLGIPWRVAFGLQDDGWILRSDCIWHKPNPMPESVSDRPTKSHEYVFLFAKQEKYWYDADAIREPAEYGFSANEGAKIWDRAVNNLTNVRTKATVTPGEGGSRNKRTVWTIATEPTPFAHFATFPQKLIEPMILAGCPLRVCAVCGAAWVRQVEREASGAYVGIVDGKDGALRNDTAKWAGRIGEVKTLTLGFAPTCDHTNAATRPGIVLDMFFGSGTTGLVARRLGRHFLGSELNGEYVQLARKRLSEPYTLPMLGMLEAVS